MVAPVAGQGMTRRLAAIAAGILIIVVAFTLGFVVGIRSTPPPAVEIRKSEIEPYVEVWRDGELIAEWEPMDGAVYAVLDQVLRDDPALYREPQTGPPAPHKEPPRDPDRGRGPVLQEAAERR